MFDILEAYSGYIIAGIIIIVIIIVCCTIHRYLLKK